MTIGAISSIDRMRMLKREITVVPRGPVGRQLSRRPSLGSRLAFFAESIIGKYSQFDEYGWDPAVLVFLQNVAQEAERQEELRIRIERTLRLLIQWYRQNEFKDQLICRPNVYLNSLKNEIELNLSLIKQVSLHQYHQLHKLYSSPVTEQNLNACYVLLNSMGPVSRVPKDRELYYSSDKEQLVHHLIDQQTGDHQTGVSAPFEVVSRLRPMLPKSAAVSAPARTLPILKLRETVREKQVKLFSGSGSNTEAKEKSITPFFSVDPAVTVLAKPTATGVATREPQPRFSFPLLAKVAQLSHTPGTRELFDSPGREQLIHHLIEPKTGDRQPEVSLYTKEVNRFSPGWPGSIMPAASAPAHSVVPLPETDQDQKRVYHPRETGPVPAVPGREEKREETRRKFIFDTVINKTIEGKEGKPFFRPPFLLPVLARPIGRATREGKGVPLTGQFSSPAQFAGEREGAPKAGAFVTVLERVFRLSQATDSRELFYSRDREQLVHHLIERQTGDHPVGAHLHRPEGNRLGPVGTPEAVTGVTLPAQPPLRQREPDRERERASGPGETRSVSPVPGVKETVADAYLQLVSSIVFNTIAKEKVLKFFALPRSVVPLAAQPFFTGKAARQLQRLTSSRPVSILYHLTGGGRVETKTHSLAVVPGVVEQRSPAPGSREFFFPQAKEQLVHYVSEQQAADHRQAAGLPHRGLSLPVAGLKEAIRATYTKLVSSAVINTITKEKAVNLFFPSGSILMAAAKPVATGEGGPRGGTVAPIRQVSALFKLAGKGRGDLTVHPLLTAWVRAAQGSRIPGSQEPFYRPVREQLLHRLVEQQARGHQGDVPIYRQATGSFLPAAPAITPAAGAWRTSVPQSPLGPASVQAFTAPPVLAWTVPGLRLRETVGERQAQVESITGAALNTLVKEKVLQPFSLSPYLFTARERGKEFQALAPGSKAIGSGLWTAPSLKLRERIREKQVSLLAGTGTKMVIKETVIKPIFQTRSFANLLEKMTKVIHIPGVKEESSFSAGEQLVHHLIDIPAEGAAPPGAAPGIPEIRAAQGPAGSVTPGKSVVTVFRNIQGPKVTTKLEKTVAERQTVKGLKVRTLTPVWGTFGDLGQGAFDHQTSSQVTPVNLVRRLEQDRVGTGRELPGTQAGNWQPAPLVLDSSRGGQQAAGSVTVGPSRVTGTAAAPPIGAQPEGSTGHRQSKTDRYLPPSPERHSPVRESPALGKSGLAMVKEATSMTVTKLKHQVANKLPGLLSQPELVKRLPLLAGRTAAGAVKLQGNYVTVHHHQATVTNQTNIANDVAMEFYVPGRMANREPAMGTLPSQRELINRFGNLIYGPELPPSDHLGRPTQNLLTGSVPGTGATSFSMPDLVRKVIQGEELLRQEQLKVNELTQKVKEQEAVIYKLNHAHSQLQENVAAKLSDKTIRSIVLKELREKLRLDKMRYGLQ